MKPFIVGILSSVAALWPGYVHAGCRPVHHHRVKQALVVGYAPAYPPQWYGVGQQLQASAFEDRIVDKLVARLQAPAQQQTAPCPTCQPTQPQTLPLTAEVDRWALVKQNCVSCHSSAEKAMSAFDLSGDLETLTCEQRLSAIRALVDGTMPKGKKLSPEVLGDLIGVFSGSENVGK